MLVEVCSQHHAQRKTNTAKFLNLFPYRADYFGHKRHMDRNEKLVMYGLKHILAIDCHSRFIAAFSTMSVKNNAIIYDEVYWYFFIVGDSKSFLRKAVYTMLLFSEIA